MLQGRVKDGHQAGGTVRGGRARGKKRKRRGCVPVGKLEFEQSPLQEIELLLKIGLSIAQVIQLSHYVKLSELKVTCNRQAASNPANPSQIIQDRLPITQVPDTVFLGRCVSAPPPAVGSSTRDGDGRGGDDCTGCGKGGGCGCGCSGSGGGDEG